MPKRLLRDGILESRAVNALSEPAEILYRRLMSIVDDYGRFEADPELIRARCFPLQLDRWPTERVARIFAELHRDSPLILHYSVGQKSYLQIQNFGQRIQTKSSKCPDPPMQSTVIHSDPPKSTVIHGDSPLRASRARTESETKSESETETNAESAASVSGVLHFDDWWKLWSSVKGTARHIPAGRAYISVVTPELESQCMECTQSYLSSLGDPTRGFNPDKFLFEQADEKFCARWPSALNGKRRDVPLSDYNPPEDFTIAQRKEREEFRRRRGYVD